MKVRHLNFSLEEIQEIETKDDTECSVVLAKILKAKLQKGEKLAIFTGSVGCFNSSAKYHYISPTSKVLKKFFVERPAMTLLDVKWQAVTISIWERISDWWWNLDSDDD